MWVRAYLRRIEQLQATGQLDIRQLGIAPTAAADANRIATGTLAAIGIAVLLGLLVYFADRVNDTAFSGCLLPPCY